MAIKVVSKPDPSLDLWQSEIISATTTLSSKQVKWPHECRFRTLDTQQIEQVVAIYDTIYPLQQHLKAVYGTVTTAASQFTGEAKQIHHSKEINK